MGAPFDPFGTRPNYTVERPWLFEPFDQIQFYAVSREEFDVVQKQYRKGTYRIESESTVFSLTDYDALCERTKDEVQEILKLQRAGSAMELAK